MANRYHRAAGFRSDPHDVADDLPRRKTLIRDGTDRSTQKDAYEKLAETQCLPADGGDDSGGAPRALSAGEHMPAPQLLNPAGAREAVERRVRYFAALQCGARQTGSQARLATERQGLCCPALALPIFGQGRFSHPQISQARPKER